MSSIYQVGRFPVTELAERYGDPLYVYDGAVIARQIRVLREVLDPGVEIFYSMKANPNPSIVALLSGLANGLDASSLCEMRVGMRSGFPAGRVFFVGPSKSAAEIEAAVRARIGGLVVESECELHLADAIAGRLGLAVKVLLRVNPAFDAAGSKLRMSGASSQFGIDEERIDAAVQCALALPNIRMAGLHCYIGTRILDWAVAVRNTREILEMALRIRERRGLDLEIVDVGGGLGVPYFPGEQAFDVRRFAENVNPLFLGFAERSPGTRMVMELGRYLVAESGVYVTRVRYVKRSRGRKYALVSGGMNHHQATTSIGSVMRTHFPVAVLNKMDQAGREAVSVCGPLCTPHDILAREVELPAIEPGDLIGILNSGAYGLTASPGEFLSHGSPGEVLVYKGEHCLIRPRGDPDEGWKRVEPRRFEATETQPAGETYAASGGE